MALTKAAPARTVTGPDSVQCDGHKKPARKFQAGPTSKNPGRWFYTCPLARDDPERCKFFKWADDAPTPISGSTPNAAGQTLGASPGPRLGLSPIPTTPSRLMRPTGSALHTPSKAHPHSPAPAVSSATRTPTHPHLSQTPRRASDEIDWQSLNPDGLEREAMARTPQSSHSQTVRESQSRTQSEERNQSQGRSQSTGLQARLEAVLPLAMKRKLSDEGDQERTPKRAAGNPFLTTPAREVSTPSHTHTPHTPSLTPGSEAAGGVHPALGGMVTALAEVGEHVARQERLVRAAECMKRSMRTTIKNLQDRVKALEAELEVERAKNR
ncbi:hypothetical protein CspeluHIS016_0203010 [Cutaneotrichosporon spelunceum]|uniref:GRF-type domain-containing protein n=1 Tax=Cutaneotrichosporon spelunceum TaxID=1672016 RepID=A0AAD3TR18_9TREE|nr:hypothetical protein CspeluHIS016_0203010 [Cutaneotrichosporon spelunceum]